jgi:hypothetical protein
MRGKQTRRGVPSRRSFPRPLRNTIRDGSDGEIIGVTLITAKLLFERDGELRITIPERLRVEGQGLAEALRGA